MAHFHVPLHNSFWRLHRKMRGIVGQYQQKWFASVLTHELDGVVRQYVGEIAAITFFLRPIYVQMIIVIVGVAPAETNELLEPAGVRVEARVEGPIVPFPDQARTVRPSRKDVPNCSFAKTDTVKPSALKSIDGTCSVGVLAGQKTGSGRRAHGRAGIMLGQAYALVGESVEVRRPGPALVEQAEVAITHVISNNEDAIELAHRLEDGVFRPRVAVSDPGPRLERRY